MSFNDSPAVFSKNDSDQQASIPSDNVSGSETVSASSIDSRQLRASSQDGCTVQGDCPEEAPGSKDLITDTQKEGDPEGNAQTKLPFDKRPSYLRIQNRLQRIRVFPALAASSCALVVTAAVCGSFAFVGLVNMRLLRNRQNVLEQDGSVPEEQRDNALRITRMMVTKEVIFCGLYILVASAHCWAAAAANHLRSAVRPFDSRLRRKRQRARAFRKLGVAAPPPEGLPAHSFSGQKNLIEDTLGEDALHLSPIADEPQYQRVESAQRLSQDPYEEGEHNTPEDAALISSSSSEMESSERFSETESPEWKHEP
ncbi:hypothetical protein Efla_005275 [Eimeria flavescens]